MRPPVRGDCRRRLTRAPQVAAPPRHLISPGAPCTGRSRPARRRLRYDGAACASTGGVPCAALVAAWSASRLPVGAQDLPEPVWLLTGRRHRQLRDREGGVRRQAVAAAAAAGEPAARPERRHRRRGPLGAGAVGHVFAAHHRRVPARRPRADTEYFAGFRAGSGTLARFRTFGRGAFNFVAAFASCAGGTRVVPMSHVSNSGVFAALNALDPHVFIHMGDLHYYNITGPAKPIEPLAGLFRRGLDRVLSQERQALFYRRTPLVYVWDDHDYGTDDSDTTAHRPATPPGSTTTATCRTIRLPLGPGGRRADRAGLRHRAGALPDDRQPLGAPAGRAHHARRRASWPGCSPSSSGRRATGGAGGLDQHRAVDRQRRRQRRLGPCSPTSDRLIGERISRPRASARAWSMISGDAHMLALRRRPQQPPRRLRGGPGGAARSLQHPQGRPVLARARRRSATASSACCA